MSADYLRNRLTDISYSYHMLIIESATAELYLDEQCQISAGSVSDYNYRMVKVIAQKKINSILTVLFEVKGELIGWFQPTDSIMLYHKKFEHVIVDYEHFKSPAINALMNNKADLSHAFKSYQIVSKYFAIHDGEQIEAIYTGNRFLGFAPSHVLSRSVKLKNSEAELTLGLYTVYASPTKEEPVTITFDSELPVQVIDSYPQLKMYKVKQESLTGWIDQSAIPNYELDRGSEDRSPEELMMEHVIETWIAERNQHKTVIKKLLNESMTLRSRLVKMDQRKMRTEQLYHNLKNSKLGRIQIAFWERKSRGGRRK